MSATTRLTTEGDAAEIGALLRANREFLTPWEPVRPAEFFTDEGQRRLIKETLRQYEGGATLPHVIVDDGRIVGRVMLTGIARGPFQSCHLGYWVARDANGRGIATAAVGRIAGLAFGELGLHRVEAGTLVHNAASQKVLERNGFRRYGVAPRYLKIAGEWQDHVLFQLLADDERA
ncbi:GNAT family N-acetyltransferase [Paractinoplanes atraurantiacus]|uniref:Ribosomal-protein-alanine N-acetyltransferase n=1 Tax=Paractinoplanes atraurantiacus TaxID=1036182 RepID=A0A285FPD8_9ACTN|nr:GNAT family protein [Actinoplanes atraurantiacus]SNY12953.1 ribosomal-protein-alanine N-acetyltransferase [Actinoplanes atraurantiacus]